MAESPLRIIEWLDNLVKIPENTLEDVELTERINWLIKLRWLAGIGVVITAGITKWLNIPIHHPAIFLAGLVIIGYNIGLFLFSSREKNHKHLIEPMVVKLLANLQISLDLFMLALLIHFSGGVENPFAFYFIFHMIIASILLSVSASIAQATLAVVLFSAVVLGEYAGVLKHFNLNMIVPEDLYRNGMYNAAVLAVFITTMYISVFIATSITSRLRQREREIIELSKKLDDNSKKLHKAYDKLSDVERTKSTYMRKVSHELRSPLAAIQSLLKVIMEGLAGDINPKSLELISRAERRSRELLRLINDLLVLSRSRESKSTETFMPVDLNEMMGKVIDLLSAKAEDKLIKVIPNLSGEPLIIKGDLENIEQLFTNLVSNAIKYTPDGGTVTIKTGLVDGFNTISVKDTGIGIPEEDLGKIFEEFYRSKNARSVIEDGTGLGLSIVKSIVELHHGTIRVASKVGEGTEFEIRVPQIEK